ncbi:hypothetical protein SLEP1_g58101 [Rubroshorea leprosula]|nr:hypothetical protein SLEP1_g58101 [Rubroshorea leprosula]
MTIKVTSFIPSVDFYPVTDNPHIENEEYSNSNFGVLPKTKGINLRVVMGEGKMITWKLTNGMLDPILMRTLQP